MLEAALGLTIPRGEDSDMVVDCPVEGLRGQSYQEWLIRLPVKLYGWGLRSLKDCCGPAYIGALETALPFMAAGDMLCPQMENLWGGEECWGRGAEGEGRWRVALQSGSQEGRELERAWGSMVEEGRQAADWLGQELEAPFSVALEELGEGCTTGETRGKLVEARERTRSLLLSRALSTHRPRQDRHVLAFRQRDKLSVAWTLCLPGSSEAFTNEEFTTAAATNLCLPPPVCVERVGEEVKRRPRVVIDLHGDNIQATPLPGDHWRLRHDSLKLLLYRLCVWSGVKVDMEVFNLFSRYIPQEGLSRINSHRQRQGLIPDLRILLPVGPENKSVLHEVKVISCSQTRYKPGWEERGVDRRADMLHQEYVSKARKVDRDYVGTEVGEMGPVERKLLSFERVQGVVFGAWGEASEPVHRLIDVLATSRVRVAGPQRGRKGMMRSEEGERSVVVGMLRRKLSAASVKAQTSSLLGRLETLGPGWEAAAGRRREALERENQWARERSAQLCSLRSSRNTVRGGFAMLN